MNLAFQITKEDVEAVLSQHNITRYDIDAIMEMIDIDAVCDAALHADIEDDDSLTLGNQTQCAYDEMTRQLIALHIL